MPTRSSLPFLTTTDALADGGNPAQTPAFLGYRWPAEWEAHEATWLSWPHNRDTWPGCLEAVEDTFGTIVRELSLRERVCINIANPAMVDRAKACLQRAGVEPDAPVDFFEIATDDAWIRDHGPIFVVREADGKAEKALVDFGFDAWGKKYPPWDQDNAVPRHIAAATGLRRFEADFTLEAGSIDGNGKGVVLTTESCLLHPNRGPGRTREEMATRLAESLGVQQVLWLGGGIEGDDTDGHVDELTRFVSTQTLVTAVEADPGDSNYRPLQENLQRLRSMSRPDGGRFEIASLPMPCVRDLAGSRYPASYANFYLANDVALVPTFGLPSDELAMAILGEVLSGREIIGIPSRDLVVGLGSLHCLTQQEPAI